MLNDIPAKKSLGQNFLKDEKIINLIAKIGDIKNTDTIIEVGPGTGNLTEKILEKTPKEFIVIEKDIRMINLLNKRFGNKIKIINDDMLKFSYEEYYDKKLIIFGNLPYNISASILAKWIKISELDSFCKKFILMFQKEVADRIIANTNSKSYGRLSILSNWKLEVEKIIDIEPSSFKPSPKIKSTLLKFTPKKNFYNLKNPKNLEHITNIFFNQRRKMIKHPLKLLFENFEEIAKKLNLDLNLRPQNLSNTTYYKICEMYEGLID